MKFIKKHFSVTKKCFIKTKTILNAHRLVDSSEIKKNGCGVLMINGNAENGLTPGVTYLDEIWSCG